MKRASTMPPNTIARNVLLPWVSLAIVNPPSRGSFESTPEPNEEIPCGRGLRGNQRAAGEAPRLAMRSKSGVKAAATRKLISTEYRAAEHGHVTPKRGSG